MMANIHNLSPEIAALIAEYLEVDDLFNYRLASRYLTACSHLLFIKRYFHQRVHLLSPEGLMTLLNISCHPDLGPLIKSIYISPDHLVPDYLCLPAVCADLLPRPIWCSFPQGTVAETGCEGYLISQENFQKMGWEATCLARTLRKASNCHTVGLNGWERPWGAGIAKRETGFFPTSSTDWDDSKSFIRRAIHVIIGALAASEAQITTLDFGTVQERVHMHPDMLDLPEFCWDKGLPWITSLKTLSLAVDSSYDEDPELWAKSLSNFIMQFPRLESLHLCFDTGLEQAGFAALKRILAVPGIRNLELSNIICYPEDLLDFFYVHRNTLKEISLDAIAIDKQNGGSWQSLVAGIRDRLSLASFGMSCCRTSDDYDIWVGEGDHDISTNFLVTGRDHDLFDRLIDSIREGVAKGPLSDELYIIRGPVH
ncbi:uncharacterized protein N7484_006740 [Penicillium longicatenatum]|uniref:uncharacterized protein n=1 Tax=Penicillium longicatenatum TaxID=1561947 RepID=UPI0025496D39|nr:uncharacterized protein N7484_006740 [Penicillium longicatenatum]KAJ5644233.1 hypothetical protein N7484_006740 [Penicillium longicatenatum]